MAKEWKIHPRTQEDIIDQLLTIRKVAPEDREVFLSPDWERDTHHYSLFQAIDRAVSIVFTALKAGKSIVVHGDYDADGTCGSAILYETLTEIANQGNWSSDISVYLPDREKDGYGVAMHTVERLAKEGKDVLITVDCGIANADSLDRGHALGMDVVVCDHHQLGERLPEHAAIIHPLAPGEVYPNKSLCGAGVAFKFAWALFDHARSLGLDIPKGREKWLMDLVGIATVTDVMPLIGENRALEYFGLQTINRTRRPGLLQLIEQTRSTLGDIDTQTIGFRIGPRINAAGRVASAFDAFKALTAPSRTEAASLVSHLETLNRQRQQLTRAAFKEAHVQVKEQEDALVHVVWSETWAPGIVGLVAGRIANKMGRPAFALTRSGETFVGSGRSAGGLHLVEAMQACGDIFLKAGGHPEACGLTIAHEEHVQTFQERINAYAKEQFGKDAPEPTIEIDAELPLQEVDWDMYGLIQSLQPFGQGNPEPTFVARDLQLVSVRAVGSDNNHLKVSVNPPTGRLWKMIGFGFGDFAKTLNPGDHIDVVYQLQVNEWNGNRSLEARIVDLRPVVS